MMLNRKSFLLFISLLFLYNYIDSNIIDSSNEKNPEVIIVEYMSFVLTIYSLILIGVSYKNNSEQS